MTSSEETDSFLQYLSHTNAHPRDAAITFFEEGHRYEIAHDLQTTYTSVTTWVHSLFPEFNSDAVITKMMQSDFWRPGHRYWGYTADQIKGLWKDNADNSCKDGTAMHYAIECFYNRYCWMYDEQQQQQQQTRQPSSKSRPTHADLLALYHQEVRAPPQTKEWQYFLQFVADHPTLVPFRTEWMLYDESLQICGSVDMLYWHPDDDTLSIYDWKRSKAISRTNMQNEFSHQVEICHLPNANFWHYSLQLNMYKQLLQRQYGRRIRDLCLVRFHPNASTYEKIPVSHLDTEMHHLVQSRLESVVAAQTLQSLSSSSCSSSSHEETEKKKSI